MGLMADRMFTSKATQLYQHLANERLDKTTHEYRAIACH